MSPGGALPGTHWLARPVGSGKGCGLAGAEETAAPEAKPSFTSCWGSGPRAGLGVHGQAWGAVMASGCEDRPCSA